MATIDTTRFPFVNTLFDTIVFDVEKMEQNGETQFNLILNLFTIFNGKPVYGMLYRTGIVVNTIEQAYFHVQQMVNSGFFTQKISSVGLIIDLDTQTKHRLDWNSIKKLMLTDLEDEDPKNITIH